MSARRARYDGPTLPGFAAEGSEAQPEPDRAERSSPEPLHFCRNEHPDTCEAGRGICDPGCPCPECAVEERPSITPSPQPTMTIPIRTDGPIDASSAIPPTTVPTPPSPLVAVSDGTQDIHGQAPLSGTPLPEGFRAWLPPGWTQPGPILVCAVCRHGTVLVDPTGQPRHRTCPTPDDIERAKRGKA